MTDLCDVPIPARASAASNCGSVKAAQAEAADFQKVPPRHTVAKRAAAIGSAKDRQHKDFASQFGSQSGLRANFASTGVDATLAKVYCRPGVVNLRMPRGRTRGVRRRGRR